MTQRPALALLAALLLLGGGAACRKPKVVKTKAKAPTQVTAAQLLEEGRVLLQHGRWEDGRKQLRYLEENLPNNEVFPTAKLLIADSFFFSGTTGLPEALVEYRSFLNFFPRHPMRDYALYHAALCHYAAIENAERDQASTQKAIEAFQDLLKESPGSVYAVDAKAKILQCWRRIAESELVVGIYYVKSRNYPAAERRIKGLLETYPEYVDRERAYYYLAEAMNRKDVDADLMVQWEKDYLAKMGKDDFRQLSPEELKALREAAVVLADQERAKYKAEARANYQKLVESYPQSVWAGRAKDRLVEMGQKGIQEELDS